MRCEKGISIDRYEESDVVCHSGPGLVLASNCMYVYKRVLCMDERRLCVVEITTCCMSMCSIHVCVDMYVCPPLVERGDLVWINEHRTRENSCTGGKGRKWHAHIV